MKKRAAIVARLARAETQWFTARGRKRKEAWRVKVERARADLKRHDEEKRANVTARRRAHQRVLNWKWEYGVEPMRGQALEFAQDYLRYRVNKPLSSERVLRRFTERRKVVSKKLHRATGELKLNYLIELRYLSVRIRQTLFSPETKFSVAAFFDTGDRFADQ